MAFEQCSLFRVGGASGVSQNSATIEGTIATSGLQTSYGFEIGTEPGNYGPATGFGSIGGLNGAQGISVYLEDLQPGTTYYYRLIATNVDGTSYGADQTFTTPGYPNSIMQPATPPLLTIPVIAFPKEEKVTTPSKPSTNAQKLVKALKVCREKKAKGKRVSCERQARKKYGAVRKRTKA